MADNADLLGISSNNELALLQNPTIGLNNYYRGGILGRMSLNGGESRPLADRVRFADWSPDGQQVAAVLEGNGHQRLEFPMGHVVHQTSSLWLLTPRISPTGDRVAFWEWLGGESNVIKTVDRAGTVKVLTSSFKDWWGLAWSSKGDEVWFGATEESAGEQPAVFAVDLSGRRRLVFRTPGNVTLHDVSKQGQVLATRDSLRSFIEIDGGGSSDPRDISTLEQSRVAGLSLDRQTVLIAAMGDGGGSLGAVYVRKLDGSPVLRVSDGVPLALAPGGESALVRTSTPPFRLSIVPTAIGASRPFEIGSIDGIEWGGFRPDGQMIFLSMEKDRHPPRVYAVPSSAGPPQPITPEGIHVMRFDGNVVSPDGVRLVAHDSNGALVLCRTDASGCEPLKGARPQEFVAGWSSDGQAVYVYHHGEVPARISLLTVQSGQRSNWKDLQPRNRAGVSGLYRLFVAPNGVCLYSYMQTLVDLYLIDGLK